jgi:hypothetical protein
MNTEYSSEPHEEPTEKLSVRTVLVQNGIVLSAKNLECARKVRDHDWQYQFQQYRSTEAEHRADTILMVAGRAQEHQIFMHYADLPDFEKIYSLFGPDRPLLWNK